MKRLNRIVVLMLAVFALFITCKSDGGGDPDDEGYTYTVTFNKNGGDTEATPATMTVTSPATNVGTLPTAPVKAGYALVGWNTKADGSGGAFTATTTVTADITVYAKWEEAAVGDFHIVLENTGEETGDAVTRSPARADAGDTITITYTLANINLNNRLTFSGTTETIAEVDEPGTGTRAYTVNEDDADVDGIIRILATFIHTNKTIDTIAFTENVVTVKFGDTPATITVSNTGEGSRTITYSSSDDQVATVNETSGQVTLVAVGSTTITATKAGDETYEVATASYTLIVNKGTGETLSGSLAAVSNGITPDSIEIGELSTTNGQTVEYGINTSSSAPATWQHSHIFTELSASTTYYIFARAAENNKYEAGPVISASITTAAPVALKISYDFTTDPGSANWETAPANAMTVTWLNSVGGTANANQPSAGVMNLAITSSGGGTGSASFILKFTLGAGETLADYKGIRVNFAPLNNDTQYKQFTAELSPTGTFGRIGATGQVRIVAPTNNSIGGTGAWTSKDFDFNATVRSGYSGEVKIAIGTADYLGNNAVIQIKSVELYK